MEKVSHSNRGTHSPTTSKSKLVSWISRNQSNLLVMGAITFSLPVQFMKYLFSDNKFKKKYWNKKSCLTISFDCDYPADAEALPQICNLLHCYDLYASFAVVGHWIEQYPNEHKIVVDHGHEIMNHTYSHPDNEILNPGRKFREIPKSEKNEELEKCHEICWNILSVEPRGSRIPHFKNLFTPEIYEISEELGYDYSSSTWLTNTTSGGYPFFGPQGIIEFPLSTCPKHPFTVFDTWHSLNTPRLSHRIIHNTEQEYLDLFKQLIDMGIETNSYINIYIDPADILKMKNFYTVLDYIHSRENELDVMTYSQLADRILSETQIQSELLDKSLLEAEKVCR